ncbi:MAG: polyphosphate kinase 2 [Eubacteriales bacterium]|nr:polyphosphate kinase 2 [Eubacteriales bacterium]
MAKQKLNKDFYEKELRRLQTELVYVQRWVKETGARIVVIFEGRDAAGKGGAIKRITELLNPRICRVVALPVPTEKEKTQWYFQRYIAHLPSAGEMVLFDRSWYNRAGVEKVMGFCTDAQYESFMRTCPDFENMLIRDGIILIKYWFSVSEEEQKRRFESRINDKTKQWKISPMDMQSRQHWVDYSRAKDAMLRYTDTKLAPWYIVDAEDKKKSRLNCISHLLSVIPYEHIEFPKLELQPLQEDETYIRPPMDEQTWIPDVASQENEKYLASLENADKGKKEKKNKKDKKRKDDSYKQATEQEKHLADDLMAFVTSPLSPEDKAALQEKINHTVEALQPEKLVAQGRELASRIKHWLKDLADDLQEGAEETEKKVKNTEETVNQTTETPVQEKPAETTEEVFEEQEDAEE